MIIYTKKIIIIFSSALPQKSNIATVSSTSRLPAGAASPLGRGKRAGTTRSKSNLRSTHDRRQSHRQPIDNTTTLATTTANNIPRRRSKRRSRTLLHVMMMRPHGQSAHVHGNWHHYSSAARWLTRATRSGLMSTGSAARGQSRLNPLPLGATILKPNLHLHLRQLQGMCDVRALRQTQVLLGVKLTLELQQLLGREGRSTSSRFAAAAAGAALLTRRATLVLALAARHSRNVWNNKFMMFIIIIIIFVFVYCFERWVALVRTALEKVVEKKWETLCGRAESEAIMVNVTDVKTKKRDC